MNFGHQNDKSKLINNNTNLASYNSQCAWRSHILEKCFNKFVICEVQFQTMVNILGDEVFCNFENIRKKYTYK